jgi:hypothetical protein
VVHKQEDGWIGSVFPGKGGAVHHGPPRSTSQAAKADAWAHLIHDRDIAYENYRCAGSVSDKT